MADKERPAHIVDPEPVAREFHRAYERLAPQFGYETRAESRVAWEELPEAHRKLMTATVAQVLVHLASYEPPCMDDLQIESGVSAFDGHPFITVRFGNARGQLSPDEARVHAQAVLHCAEAAETDAIIARIFDGEDMAFHLISALRAERAKGWPERVPPPKEAADRKDGDSEDPDV